MQDYEDSGIHGSVAALRRERRSGAGVLGTEPHQHLY